MNPPNATRSSTAADAVQNTISERLFAPADKEPSASSLLYEEGCFAGLETQINRIKTKGSGDLEYVTAALALLLQGSDASSNYEVMVDYSRPEKVNAVISLYGIYQLSFEKQTQLPSVKIEGYEFLGFHDSNNNLITVATEDMEIILNAFYEKK